MATALREDPERLEDRLRRSSAGLVEHIAALERVLKEGARLAEHMQKSSNQATKLLEALDSLNRSAKQPGREEIADFGPTVESLSQATSFAAGVAMADELASFRRDFMGQLDDMLTGARRRAAESEEKSKRVLQKLSKIRKTVAKKKAGDAPDLAAVEDEAVEALRQTWTLERANWGGMLRPWCAFMSGCATRANSTLALLAVRGGAAQWASAIGPPEALPAPALALLGLPAAAAAAAAEPSSSSSSYSSSSYASSSAGSASASDAAAAASTAGKQRKATTAKASPAATAAAAAANAATAATAAKPAAKVKHHHPPPCWWSDPRFRAMVRPTTARANELDRLAASTQHVVLRLTRLQARWRGILARRSTGRHRRRTASVAARPLPQTPFEKRRQRRTKVTVPAALPYWPDRYTDDIIKHEVLRINFELLFRRLTQPGVSAPRLRRVFLLHYTTFMRADELVFIAGARFRSVAAETAPRPRDEVQLEVLALLELWLQTAAEDLSNGGAGTLALLALLVPAREAATTAAAVKAAIDRLLGTLDDALERCAAADATRRSSFSVSSAGAAAPNVLLLTSAEPRGLLDLHPVEIARQLTLLDREAFAWVRPSELIEQRWTKDGAAVRCPALLRVIDRFNVTCKWATAEVLAGDGTSERAFALARLIEVAAALLDLNNFSGLMALLSALQCASVARLQYSWERVPPASLASFEDLKELMDMSYNYRGYRERLRELLATAEPVLPYVGLVLQDLTFADEGNDPSIGDGEMLNVAKMTLVHGVIEEALTGPKRPYVLHMAPQIAAYLTAAGEDGVGCAGMAATEDEMYKRSLALEPRGMEPPKRAARKAIKYDPLPAVAARGETPLDAPVEALLELMLVCVYRAGATILTAGAAGERQLYFLSGGVLAIDLPDGRTVTPARGTFFGEIGALLDAPRSATVRAVSDVEVLVLGERELERALLQQGFTALFSAMRELGKARLAAAAAAAVATAAGGAEEGGADPAEGSASFGSASGVRRGVRLARRRQTMTRTSVAEDSPAEGGAATGDKP